MVVETTKEQIVLNQIIGQKKEIRTVEADIIVNDIKPDVLNIVSVSGVINIYKKEVENGRVRIDGGINTYIIYMADDEQGTTRSLNNCMDFTQIIDIDNCTEGMMVEENITVKNYETKIINGRKINVKVNLEVGANVYSNENIEVVTGISNTTNMKLLNRSQKVTSLLGTGINKIYAKDTIAIDVADDIAEIMKVNFNIMQEETKISYNKVLSKANANVEIMYLTEDNRINTVNSKIPVMGVVDMLNINENCICNTKNTLKNLVIKPNGAEGHSIYIEAEIELSCIAYESKEINVIEDLYSLETDIETEKKQINIMTERRTIQETYTMKENIRVPDLTGTIYNISASPMINKYETMRGKAILTGEVSVELLFNQNNSMNSRIIQLPFNYEMNSDVIDNNVILEPMIVTNQTDAVIKDGNVELMINLGINLNLTMNAKLDIIREINTEDRQSGKMYSMTIYFVKPGDTLWKIAKMFRSTVEDIAEINEIEDVNRINVGEQLYIPKGIKTRSVV